MTITGNKPDFIIIDEFGRIDEKLFDQILRADWGDLELRAIALQPEPPMPKLPFIDVEDIRFRDPKQPAWANANQAPRNVRKRP